jgi:hypothetical protein
MDPREVRHGTLAGSFAMQTGTDAISIRMFTHALWLGSVLRVKMLASRLSAPAPRLNELTEADLNDIGLLPEQVRDRPSPASSPFRFAPAAAGIPTFEIAMRRGSAVGQHTFAWRSRP